jgi:hypothetical protein
MHQYISELVVSLHPLAVGCGNGAIEVNPDVILLLFSLLCSSAAEVHAKNSCILRSWTIKVSLVITYVNLDGVNFDTWRSFFRYAAQIE